MSETFDKGTAPVGQSAMVVPGLSRTREQRSRVDPEKCANENSQAANFYLLRDAKSDIEKLHMLLQVAHAPDQQGEPVPAQGEREAFEVAFLESFMRPATSWCRVSAIYREPIEQKAWWLWQARSAHPAQTEQQPTAYLRASDLERLAPSHVAGCAASLSKEPGNGLVAIYTAPIAQTAQPAEAEGSIRCPASHPAECYAPGTHVVHASLVHGIVRQADALSAALSAVTAERDQIRAEVQRLRDDLEVMTADRDGCARQRDQLRAELWTGAWTVPTPDPDVSVLVEALKEARAFTLEHDSGRAGYVRGRIDAALAAREAHHNPTTQED